jgi:D-alanyl-D-alanine carboxypeptidase
MNTRLRNMGLVNTNLVRPDGWGVKNHHSTARDLATFTMYALNYPTFVDLISTTSYTTTDGNYTVTNTNKMLNLDYPGLIGGKTGYDDDAGYCLIEVARRHGNTMISVTLDGVAPDDWYDDNRVLLDYAFEQKEAREDDNKPITGEVLSYRDPDAAQILQQATPGGSAGDEPPPSPEADTDQLPSLTTPTNAPPEAAIASDESDNSGGMNGKLILAVAVTAVVVGAGILGSVASGTGRSPRPRSQPRPRRRPQGD